MTIALILFGGMIVFLILGFPIVISIGLASVVGFIYSDVMLAQVTQKMFAAVNSFTILAVPFFMLAGSLMESGGMSKRLIRFANAMACWVSGGLAHVQVLASCFFAALSGSAPATCAAIGNIMIPKMKEKGYPVDFTCTVQAVSGTIGTIIPPSIPMVVYGVAAGASIGKIFAAGMIPGILYGLSFMIIVYFTAKKQGFGKPEKFDPKEVWLSFKDAIWALLVPIIILGGIYSGLFTPTEAGAVACVYGIFAGKFIYKELTFKKVVTIMASASVTTTMVLLIIAAAAAFSWIMAMEGVGVLVGSVFAGTSGKVVFMLAVIALLTFMGCFMECIASILIVTPVLLPIALSMGIDPVQFGVVMVMTLSLGISTPPVGSCLYITAGIAGIKFEEEMKYLWKFVLAGLLVIVLVAMFPGIAMFLPNLLFK